MYFVESEYENPESPLKLKRFRQFEAIDVFKISKFIGSHNSESYFVINDYYLIFHGRLSPAESTETKMYGLMITNLESNKEICLVKNKEHYFQINIDYKEMKLYCLTAESEVEIYKIETGDLVDIIELKEYTEEIVLSLNADSGKLIIGTIYGTIIEIDEREITKRT